MAKLKGGRDLQGGRTHSSEVSEPLLARTQLDSLELVARRPTEMALTARPRPAQPPRRYVGISSTPTVGRHHEEPEL